MNLNLLLIPAIGGYWILTRWHITRYRTERDSGYHLLFRSTGAGVLLTLVAHPTAFVLAILVPEPFVWWNANIPQPFTAAVILSLFMAAVTPTILNKFADQDECAEQVAWEMGDNVELFMEEAMQDQKMVEVDLRSRKVYVGFSLDSGIGKSSETDVILMPVGSGHRDEATLELKLDINYLPILDSFQVDEDENESPEGGRDSEDFLVVVPISEIVSVRIFDGEIYDMSHGISEKKVVGTDVGPKPESKTNRTQEDETSLGRVLPAPFLLALFLSLMAIALVVVASVIWGVRVIIA